MGENGSYLWQVRYERKLYEHVRDSIRRVRIYSDRLSPLALAVRTALKIRGLWGSLIVHMDD